MTPTEINLNLDQARRKTALILQEHIKPIETHYLKEHGFFYPKLRNIEEIIELLDAAMDETKRARQ